MTVYVIQYYDRDTPYHWTDYSRSRTPQGAAHALEAAYHVHKGQRPFRIVKRQENVVSKINSIQS